MEVMEVSTIVARLKGLREEFGDHTLACGAAQPVALILSDVCYVLGLTEEERQEVLGQEVTEAVDEWAGCRLWVLPKEDP